MNDTTIQKKKFSWSFAFAMVALMALAVRVMSYHDLQQRLGATYTSITLLIAGFAVASLAFHVHDRLIRH